MEAPHGTLMLPGLNLPLHAHNGAARLDTAALRRARPQLARVLRAARPAPVRPERIGGALFVRSCGETATGAHRRAGVALAPAGDERAFGAGATTRIEYRDVAVELSTPWVWEHLSDWAAVYGGADTVGTLESHGICSSVRTTLSTLWSKFYGETRGDFDVLRSVIGCHNLPKVPSADDLFYRAGWGGHGMALLYTLQLLYTYVDYVRPEVGACQGLAAFIRSYLEGKDTANSAGTVCSATALLNFVNTDVRFAGTMATNSCAEVDCTTVTTDICDPTDPSCLDNCDSVGWDYFSKVMGWNTTNACWSGRGPDDSACHEVPNKCYWHGYTKHKGRILFTAVTWGFFGFVCDDILFRARIIMDAALYDTSLSERRRTTLLKKAEQMARYALRLLVYRAGHMIHEFGHLWVGSGSGHCDGPSKCCMDMARYGWECLVRARLGLPAGNYAPQSDGDFHEGYDVEKEETPDCSHNEGIGPGRMCYISKNGEEDASAFFCATDCYVAYTGATSLHCTST